MDRFRPNIVVQGDWEAFEEDHTALIEAAEVRMAFVKPCTRCSIPDIDQRSAQQFDEPGRTLASYRNLEIGVVFGQNAILDAPAQARLKAWRRGADRTGFSRPGGHGRRRVGAVPDWRQADDSFRPTSPSTISPTLTMRIQLVDSPNSTMPAMKAPMVPIPTQIA